MSKEKQKKDLLIIVPMYNEKESINHMIDSLRKLDYDFIFIDNNSIDGSKEIGESHNVEVLQREPYGNGYGGAIMKGLQVAKERGYSYMGIIDCDITYDTSFYNELQCYLYKYHMIMGIRNFDDIRLIRRFGNLIHTLFANILFGASLKDINTGMRVIHVDTFLGNVDEKYMGMMPQMTAFSLRNHLKIKEIVYPYGERLGESKLNKLKDGWVILCAIFKERFRQKVYSTPPPLM